MGPIGPMRRRLSVVETANTAIRAKKEESLRPRRLLLQTPHGAHSRRQIILEKMRREYTNYDRSADRGLGLPRNRTVMEESSMNGAESLMRTFLASGVDTCFANPGTSEMHFISALDRVHGMRCVLGLFEGVLTGAADGFARLARKPAATLLHCGPGLANGLANLHNAQRARAPMVNIVGDQATYHRGFDAPLTADAEGWARPVSIWTRTVRRTEAVRRRCRGRRSDGAKRLWHRHTDLAFRCVVE
jgi:Thiamine pyrophosphate enzyme, N-terminal TPP binding domain